MRKVPAAGGAWPVVEVASHHRPLKLWGGCDHPWGWQGGRWTVHVEKMESQA